MTTRIIPLLTSVPLAPCRSFRRTRLPPLADTCARLLTDDKRHTCLFAQSGHDLRTLIRAGKNNTEIATAMDLIWNQRENNSSETRTEETARAKKVEMSYIGG